MENKFTPGPWDFSITKNTVLAGEPTKIIAKCNAGPPRFHPPLEEIEANTYLISAAPQMFHANFTALKYLCDKNRLADDLVPVIETLQDAIIKARGQS